MSKKDTRDLLHLRLADVEIFLQIVRLGSINGAGRAMGVSPSRVSKSLARLERHLGLSLLERSPRGVVPGGEGERLAPALADLLQRARELRAPRERAEVIIVAPAFLSNALVPRLVPLLGDARIHAVEMAPGTPSAFASQPFFDIALSTRLERWPASWARTRVGKIRRGLFARPGRALELGRHPTAARLRGARFIGPLYAERGQLVPGDDGCPLSFRDRIFGHRTQTAALALDLAAASDELVFAPALAARAHVRRGALVEVHVRGWHVTEPVYLLSHRDRVTARTQRVLIGACEAALLEDL